MILIISMNNFEVSTNDVIDWLWYKNANFRRVNGSDFYTDNIFEIDINNHTTILQENDCDIHFQEAKAVWYRRYFPVGFFSFFNKYGTDDGINHSLQRFLKEEMLVIKEFLPSALDHAYWLSDPQTAAVNKLTILTLAAKAGLTIPPSLITNSKTKLLEFLQNNKTAIVKNLSNPPSVLFQRKLHSCYTSKITVQEIMELPDIFPASMFQQTIEKDYEIRAFYLEGRIYAMAIFSQADPKTALDFRHYNYKTPNRTVPYQLPAAIEEKICLLMKMADLNTGSVDMIKAPDGNYYFLEVNPIGQFGMVSYPCNYYLEEMIADLLMEKDN